MKVRLLTAMLSYAALAGLAGFTLTGIFRLAVLIFLGGLALKTLIVFKTQSS